MKTAAFVSLCSIFFITTTTNAEAFNDKFSNDIVGFPASLTEETVEDLLKDDSYGESVVVVKKDGNVVFGEVTYEEKQALQKNSEVSIIENDQPMSIFNYSWGVDRLNQKTLPLDNYYDYSGKGSGSVIYIIDTGIDYTHPDFGGRASSSGIDIIDNDSDPMDCHGHGTHVAGSAASSTYGVAPSAKIVGVRVLDCSGSGSSSSVIDGINWVANNHSRLYPGYAAVANMSLGGHKTEAVNIAVRNAVSKGITMVVAAGNSGTDASKYSPASEASAITVASTDKTDRNSYFTNYGSVVDIFAPGSNIVSTSLGGGSQTMSGTSMASPHVAGVAAAYLAENKSASPSSVDSYIKSTAVVAVSHYLPGTTKSLANVGQSESPAMKAKMK